MARELRSGGVPGANAPSIADAGYSATPEYSTRTVVLMPPRVWN